jgi:hypothetical protein
VLKWIGISFFGKKQTLLGYRYPLELKIYRLGIWD